MHVIVQYNNQRTNLDLYVVRKGGPPLFGREWLHHFQVNWKEIKSLRISQETESSNSKIVKVAGEYEKSNPKLHKLLVKYKDLFRIGIGCLTQKKATLSRKPQPTPKFIKARPIPFAMRPKVGKELEKLERDGIISKIEMSEWAYPIVPVLKNDGSVRICGDFKVTVNQVLQVDQYPLPRIGDIFATLASGRKFTKLDIRQAYLHMPLDEDSKKLLAINTHKGVDEYNRLWTKFCKD